LSFNTNNFLLFFCWFHWINCTVILYCDAICDLHTVRWTMACPLSLSKWPLKKGTFEGSLRVVVRAWIYFCLKSLNLRSTTIFR
jgi:hypothetical protein